MLSTSESHFGQDSNVECLSSSRDNTENMGNFSVNASIESRSSFFKPSLHQDSKYKHRNLRTALLSDCHLLDPERGSFANVVQMEGSERFPSHIVATSTKCCPLIETSDQNVQKPSSELVNSSPALVPQTLTKCHPFSPDSMSAFNLSSSSDSSNDGFLPTPEIKSDSKQAIASLRLPAKKRKINWNSSEDVTLVSNRRDAKFSLPNNFHFPISESIISSSPLIVDSPGADCDSPCERQIRKIPLLYYSPTAGRLTRKRSLPACFTPTLADQCSGVSWDSHQMMSPHVSEIFSSPQPRTQRRILINDSTLLLNQLRAPTHSIDQFVRREDAALTLSSNGSNINRLVTCSAPKPNNQLTKTTNIHSGHTSVDSQQQQHKSLDPRRRFSLAAANRHCQLIQDSSQGHRRFSVFQMPSAPLERSRLPPLDCVSAFCSEAISSSSSIHDQDFVMRESSYSGPSSSPPKLTELRPLSAPGNDTEDPGSPEYHAQLKPTLSSLKNSFDKSSQFDDRTPSLISHVTKPGTSITSDSFLDAPVNDNLLHSPAGDLPSSQSNCLNTLTTKSDENFLPLRDLVCDSISELNEKKFLNQFSKVNGAKFLEASRNTNLAHAASVYGTNGFPLVLFSAPTSASAAAFAAATALASGTSPSSLIPVPVEIASFHVSKSDQLNPTHSCDRSPGCNMCRRETEFSPLTLVSTHPLSDASTSEADRKAMDCIPQLIFPILSSSLKSGETTRNCAIGLPWLVPRNSRLIKTENTE